MTVLTVPQVSCAICGRAVEGRWPLNGALRQAEYVCIAERCPRYMIRLTVNPPQVVADGGLSEEHP